MVTLKNKKMLKRMLNKILNGLKLFWMSFPKIWILIILFSLIIWIIFDLGIAIIVFFSIVILAVLFVWIRSIYLIFKYIINKWRKK